MFFCVLFFLLIGFVDWVLMGSIFSYLTDWVLCFFKYNNGRSGKYIIYGMFDVNISLDGQCEPFMAGDICQICLVPSKLDFSI